MTWRTGHIEPFWQTNHRELAYRRGKYNNPSDLELWKKLGFKLNDAGGDVYDMKNVMPDWANKFFTLFKGNNVGISFFRMNTGDILPAHRDTYEVYRKINNIADSSTINRVIIFLEDWCPGHIFEIAETPITNWKAGDYVLWNYNTEHMAANIGLEPRYTMQITFTDV